MGRAAKAQSFIESAMTDFTEQLHYTCTAAVKNGELYMLHDADNLLSLATKLSSSSKNTTLSTLSTLLGSYSGLKLGWTMKK